MLRLGLAAVMREQGSKPLACRLAVLLWLAEWKQASWVVENPSSSLIFRHPRLQELIATFAARDPVRRSAWTYRDKLLSSFVSVLARPTQHSETLA